MRPEPIVVTLTTADALAVGSPTSFRAAYMHAARTSRTQARICAISLLAGIR